MWGFRGQQRGSSFKVPIEGSGSHLLWRLLGRKRQEWSLRGEVQACFLLLHTFLGMCDFLPSKMETMGT